jgi:ferric-dicitrate binding protein FerR (iron transport regulator)
MNAESKLEFPETFNGNTREVALHGEAYFEVAKDAKHPFIVKTDYFNTKVLGTSFNIRAYSERDANVVLVEGSVKVGMSGKETEHTLKPGQQFSILNSQFSIKDVDTYPYTQWRDGFFYFDDTAMIEIMQELGRWYNVNIIFEEAKYMNTHLHFVAERRLSLSDIIRNINDLGIVNVEIQKDALIVN